MSDKKRRNKSAGPAWARDGGPMSGPDVRTAALEDPWDLVDPHSRYEICVKVYVSANSQANARDLVRKRLWDVDFQFLSGDEQ